MEKNYSENYECGTDSFEPNADDYFVGLDIGTDSVGWAATDCEYNLLKARGRELWGSYLFDEAQTAEARRAFRTSRRRTARVRSRILLLQSLFAEEIAKVDPTFFIRLNNSKLLPEDKDGRIATKYILFGDERGEKDHFKRYPTIFHLRRELMSAPPTDIRLLYLACHHIVKNRGNFLYEGRKFDMSGGSSVREAFSRINEFFASYRAPDDDTDDGDAPEFGAHKIDEALTVIKDRNKGKQDKTKDLCALFGAGDERLKEAVKAMVGAKFKLSKLYGCDEYELSTSFDVGDFDGTELPKIESEIGIDNAALIGELKKIYDYGKLSDMLSDERYISAARVKSYEMHKADLALLKEYVRKNIPDKYKLIFRMPEKPNKKDKKTDEEKSDGESEKKKAANYAAYIGMDDHKSYAKATRDEFFKFLKKIVSDEDFTAFVEARIADGDTSEFTRTAAARYKSCEFLPKQITSDNGVIPYQLHLAELEKILETARSEFAFLDRADDGMTVAQKIERLVTFRIPYFVGPTGRGQSRNKWAVRNSGYEDVTVTPWNFDKAIDKDRSEEEFIRRMTCKCRYLPTEDVLPRYSLLYCEAALLNELNNMRINGDKNKGVRDMVFEYAHGHKKITKKAIVGLLKREGVVDITADAISGIDEQNGFGAQLSSYIDFRNIVGDKVDTARAACEKIIFWITLFSDRERLARRIKSEFGELFTDDEIKRLKGLNYSGWGSMSTALLDGIASDRSIGSAGEPRTVIRTLRDDEELPNLTEVLTSKRYGFDKAIEAYNAQCGFDPSVTASAIDELYCSPSVKRAIRRTLDIVSEIVKIKGHEPRKICIEMARGATDEQKNKRTTPRKQWVEERYKNMTADLRVWDKNSFQPYADVDDRKFTSDKVYLYYMQQGKSAYSGKPIDFAKLFDTNVYDIDHIYPRSKINDDSLDNRVLVYKNENMDKGNDYPIAESIRTSMRAFWEKLKAARLISDKKFMRLVRNTPITPAEQADFENRQLVAMRQSTKEVASILKRKFPNSEIVYSKASKAAEFKNMYGLVKVRELNDLHHAKDAYVNIIVGNTLNTRYGHDAHFYYERAKNPSSDAKIFDYGVDGAWDPSWVERVARIYNSNRCAVVRFVSEGSGALFNATIKTAGANDKLIPLKENGKISDTNKYGGYDSATTAYFMLVRSRGKKDKVRLSLEAIPILVDKRAEGKTEYIVAYLREKCGLTDPEILIKKIRINTLLEIDGSLAYLRGKTGNRFVVCNANELWLSSCWNAERIKSHEREGLAPSPSVEYLKKVAEFYKKYAEQQKYKKVLAVDEERDRVTHDGNIALYDALVEKLGSKIYSGLPMSGQYAKLSDEVHKQKFSKAELNVQCTIIMKILAFLCCTPVNLDMTDFGETEKNAGINKISKFIEDRDVKMICMSPTGYYRRVVEFGKFLDPSVRP